MLGVLNSIKHFFKFSKISNSFRFSNEMWVLSSIYVKNLQGSFITRIN